MSIVEKYLTEEGAKAIEGRLNSLVKTYNEAPVNAYPLTLKLWGFHNLEIKSPEEMEYRIKELGEILELKVEVNKNAN